ncbi:MAG: hypothetical protein ABJB12_21245 [Pseudomonadota bacterium]
MTARILPDRLTRLTASSAASMLLWLSRTVLALLVAYPLLSAIDATGITGSPEHDALLFRPGSLLLLELARLGLPWFGAIFKISLLLGALSALCELLPLAGALDVLHDSERPLAERAARTLRHFPRFLALGAITWAAQAALLLAASLLDTALKAALQHADERLLTLAPVAWFGLALLAGSWLSGVLDVARAAVVRRNANARDAVLEALATLREQPLALLCGSYVSTIAGLFGYLVAAWLMTRLDLSAQMPTRIALAFAVHQCAIVFGIAWRVRWLRRALELGARDSRLSSGC